MGWGACVDKLRRHHECEGGGCHLLASGWATVSRLPQVLTRSEKVYSEGVSWQREEMPSRAICCPIRSGSWPSPFEAAMPQLVSWRLAACMPLLVA
eukprot:scaffold257548_cov28-Tisochrysis_lutea.AAC.3